MKRVMKQYHIATLLAAATLLSGCSLFGEDKADGTDKVPANIILANDDARVFDSGGGETAVHFVATDAWTATIDQPWCSVDPAEGDSSVTSVTVTVVGNDSTDERNATLTLRSGDAVARLTIVQKQKDALTVTSNRIEMGHQGGEARVEVVANIPFEYEIAADASDWITPVETRAVSTTVLLFDVAANESGRKRSGEIVIRSGEYAETVTVYQSGEEPQLVLTRDNYAVGSEGETIKVELQSNVPCQMRISDGVDWLREVSSRSLSTYTRWFEVDPNDGYDSRTAEILFYDDESGVSATVTVTQMQLNAIVVSEDVYVVEAEGGRLDFEINTNVDFEVGVSEEWIRLLPESRGLETRMLQFEVDPNPGKGERVAVITLAGENIEQSITVYQNGLSGASVLHIVHESGDFTLPSIGGSHFYYGLVSWGDGSQEVYAEGASHVYTGSGPHTVSIETHGAEEFSLQNLTGVTEVDLSRF